MSRKRKTLKTIIATGSMVTILPDHWSKPALKSMLLPVHAQASLENKVFSNDNFNVATAEIGERSCSDIDDDSEVVNSVSAVYFRTSQEGIVNIAVTRTALRFDRENTAPQNPSSDDLEIFNCQEASEAKLFDNGQIEDVSVCLGFNYCIRFQNLRMDSETTITGNYKFGFIEELEFLGNGEAFTGLTIAEGDITLTLGGEFPSAEDCTLIIRC